MRLHVLFTICIVALASTSPSRAGTIANGSFETGNFAGWGVTDLSIPHQPLSVRSNGFNTSFGFFSTSATHGVFSATHGFDGNGPATIQMFQDIGTVASDSNILSFDYRAGWNMLDFAGPPAGKLDRVLNLNIFTAGSFNTLIGSNEVLRMVGGTKNSDTGSLSKSIDLSVFNGQSIRISFDAFVPQNFTGPAFFQLDNVTLSAAPATVPEPSSFAIIAIVGMIAGGMYRKSPKSIGREGGFLKPLR